MTHSSFLALNLTRKKFSEMIDVIASANLHRANLNCWIGFFLWMHLKLSSSCKHELHSSQFDQNQSAKLEVSFAWNKLFWFFSIVHNGFWWTTTVTTHFETLKWGVVSTYTKRINRKAMNCTDCVPESSLWINAGKLGLQGRKSHFFHTPGC